VDSGCPDVHPEYSVDRPQFQFGTSPTAGAEHVLLARLGSQMMVFSQFDALAMLRGEGLHPRLRALMERGPEPDNLQVRYDGMLQAGPNPASEIGAVPMIKQGMMNAPVRIRERGVGT